MFITIKMLLKMKSQNNIFDEFKAAAKEEESPQLPFSERLWDRIESRLEEEEPEKRRAFFPWIKYLAASILLLLGIGLVWKLNQETPVEHSSNEPAVAHKELPSSLHKIQSDSVVSGPQQEAVHTGKSAAQQSAPFLTGSVPTQALTPLAQEHKRAAAVDSIATPAPQLAYVQNTDYTYHGTVLDQEGNPLMGAIIYTEGNDSLFAHTEIDGQFRIKAHDTTKLYIAYGSVKQEIDKYNLLQKDTISLAYTPSGQGNNTAYKASGKPGNKKQEASQGYQSSESYSLSEQNELSSVVVYGTKIDKRTYCGSLNTIKAEDISKRPVTNVANALAGAAPGVMVTTGSGQPGSSPDILIRGQGSLAASTAPMILLDGMPYDGPLTSINPNDVDNMTVLKDATAKGIYGSRGANGVISITTKTGKNMGITAKNETADNLFHAIFGDRRQKKDQEAFQQLAQKQHMQEFLAQKGNTIPDPVIKEEEQPNESYAEYEENKFESPLNKPLSTFSIDVDKASYANIRRFITSGEQVPKDAVRIEEMINYFSYTYPQPQPGNPFSINTEYSNAPWNPRHRLLKIGLQGKIIPQDKIPPSNLVFLIDVSGSMDASNKLPYVQKSLKILTEQLRREDHVAIVVYAGAAGLVLPSTSGDQKNEILKAINHLKAGGSTAGGEGINLAYKIAKENFIQNGNNRIILATDGDFNVGASSDRSMQELIEEKRKDNIFLTCLGFGMGNYKDSKMEILADKGNGNYAYIDNLSEAKKVLQDEFGGTMYTIAKDVKIQIEFNPSLVQSYRLIGYENRVLNAEDFANDAIDAGELGSGHTVTALYEIIPKGTESTYAVNGIERKYTTTADSSLAASNELGQIKFRYKEPAENKSKLIVQNIDGQALPLELASKDFKLASSIAWFGLSLRDSKLVPDKSIQHIFSFTKEAIDKNKKEEVELVELIEAVK